MRETPPDRQIPNEPNGPVWEVLGVVEDLLISAEPGGEIDQRLVRVAVAQMPAEDPRALADALCSLIYASHKVRDLLIGGEAVHSPAHPEDGSHEDEFALLSADALSVGDIVAGSLRSAVISDLHAGETPGDESAQGDHEFRWYLRQLLSIVEGFMTSAELGREIASRLLLARLVHYQSRELAWLAILADAVILVAELLRAEVARDRTSVSDPL